MPVARRQICRDLGSRRHVAPLVGGRRAVGLGLALRAACATELVVRTRANDDAWTTIPSTDVQLQIAKTGELTVVSPRLPPSSTPHGQAKQGEQLAFTLDGVACTIDVIRRYEDELHLAHEPAPGVNQPIRYTQAKVRGSIVELACGGAPIPGTDAAARGVRSLPSIPLGLPALILGVLCGLLVRRDRIGGALGLAVLAAGAAIAIPIAMFEGSFRVTYLVLFAGLAIVGGIGGRIDMPHAWRTGTSGILGAVAGVVGIAFAFPVWSAGGPLLATLVGGVAGTVVIVLAAL